MRYCHQIQISNEKVKREGGGRQDRRKISPLLVPLTYIHVRWNSLHIVYTEFNLIHAVECSSFPTSLYRQWSCSNIWQGCKEPVQSCTNEDTEHELSYGAILSTYLRRTQEKNCCPSNQAFKLQIRSYSHCPLRQICHFFSLLATFKCVCV